MGMTSHAATIGRVAVSPGEAAAMLGITRTCVYQLIATGGLRRYHIGRRALIPIADVLALVGGDPDASAA